MRWLEWPPKDWRSIIALLASVGGGGVSFFLAWRLITFIASTRWHHKNLSAQQLLQVTLEQVTALSALAKGSMILMGISMIGLWFVLGDRTIKGKGPGGFEFEAGGGPDDDPPPSQGQQTLKVEATVSGPAGSSGSQGSA
jgi:hypothetical protein